MWEYRIRVEVVINSVELVDIPSQILAVVPEANTTLGALYPSQGRPISLRLRHIFPRGI